MFHLKTFILLFNSLDFFRIPMLWCGQKMLLRNQEKRNFSLKFLYKFLSEKTIEQREDVYETGKTAY